MFNKINLFLLQMFTTTFVGNSTETSTLETEVDHKYWETALIHLAAPKLVHDKFAQKVNIPQGGSKRIEFRKVDNLSTDISDNTLVEGVPGAGQEMTITPILAEVAQYGNYVKVTDMLEYTAKDPVLKLATEACAAQMATISDKITRDVLLEGGASFVAHGVSSLASIESATSTITGDDLFKAAARLKANDAPMIDGAYVAIMHPLVAKDLMSSMSGNTAWVDAVKYASPEDILAGEVGKYGGVRVIQSTLAKVFGAGDLVIGTKKIGENTEDVKNTTPIFATMVFGADAYGTTEITGGGAELITHNKGEIGGPLNQYSTVGWKQTKAAEILVDEYIVRIDSTATEGSVVSESN